MSQRISAIAASALKSNRVMICRSASSTGKQVVKPPQHVLEQMTRYQAAEATTPVYIVSGATDQIMYRLTLGGCIAGIGGVGVLAYELGFKKKK